MSLTRRNFIKFTGAGVAAASNFAGFQNSVLAKEAHSCVLIDVSKCTGCSSCVLACKKWNKLPIKDSVSGNSFSSIDWITVESRRYHSRESGVDAVKLIHTRKSCMHCQDAACIKVCPASAISHTASGAVNINSQKCIGCNYCIANCTFNIMGFDKIANVARKCTGCYDRIKNGDEPACVHMCPTEALSFGERGEIIKQAAQRAGILKTQGFVNTCLYGVEELNGLGMLYILHEGKDDSMGKYGLPEDPRVSLSAHIWDYLFKPVRVILVGALGFALWMNRMDSKPEPAKLDK